MMYNYRRTPQNNKPLSLFEYSVGKVITLARNVKKRIILVGDFQQLSPITTAGVPILRNSVFALCGIDINNTTHPALCPLLNQRRSNPEIVEMINKSFYSDMLKAARDKESKAKARPPYSGIVIGVKHVKDGEVNFTKGGTRQNAKNASVVMELLDKYAEDIEENFSIGVITPYTGQVAQLKFLFHKREYSTRFQERVKIGTVHTFQGSECDVIIFDMVDCGKFKKGEPYFGRIYAGEQGEELMNVAISRARDKLIVVCDTEFLNRCPGGVISDKTKSIFYKLLKHKFTKDQ